MTFPTLRRFPANAFRNPIIVRPSVYPLSGSGGANPSNLTGYPYFASVQPLGGNAREAKAGPVGGMPQSVTMFDVLIAYDPDDAVIPALKFGDEIDWGDAILTVMGTPNDSGGLGVLWRIRCQQVVQ